MIFQFFCSLFVVTRYDVDGWAHSKSATTCIWLTTRLALVALPFAVLHRADDGQPARNSCLRLPHSVDSRCGVYHVAVVLCFLRSPTGAPNGSFHSDPLKRYFRLSGVPLKLCRFI